MEFNKQRDFYDEVLVRNEHMLKLTPRAIRNFLGQAFPTTVVTSRMLSYWMKVGILNRATGVRHKLDKSAGVIQVGRVKYIEARKFLQWMSNVGWR